MSAYTSNAGQSTAGFFDDQQPTAVVVDRGGISLTLQSRTATAPVLTGTKRRVAVERQVLADRGRYDGRTLVFIPEIEDGVTVGITLLHVEFRDSLAVSTARDILQGYRNRYSALRDTVTETNPVFDETLLSKISTVELLTTPINDLADRWRSS